jgi:AcrR family transcriptional regulator
VATTIADIVARAGISRRTFYKLFDNKRDCFDAAVSAFAEEIATMAAAAQPGAGMTWPDTVREAIAQILELLASKPAFTNLVLVEAVVVDPMLLTRYWDPVLEALKQSPIFGEGTQTPTGAARAAVGAAQVLIAQEVTAGRSDQLPALLPEIVYIALVPFVGQEEALAQVRLAR